MMSSSPENPENSSSSWRPSNRAEEAEDEVEAQAQRAPSKTADPTQSIDPTTPAETGTEPPGRELLGLVGRARVFLSTSEQPWRLPADVLVLSLNDDLTLSQAAGQFLEAVPDAGYKALRSRIESLGYVPPDRPRRLTYSAPDGFAPELILATPYEDKGIGPVGWNAGARRATSCVLRLAAEHHLRRVALPIFPGRRAKIERDAAARAVVRATMDAGATNDLEEITLCTIADEAAEAIRGMFRTRAQSARNDTASGEDLLDLRGELHAIADMVMLRETKPPLVVGVLGGWGAGKSFAMHLMQERMQEIRSLPLTPEQCWGDQASPYAGHVYQICFDAWTFAKSELWASLMSTIFHELNRQITIEHRLDKDCGIPPLTGGDRWREVTRMDPRSADVFLETKLGQEALKTSPSPQPDALWTRLEKLKDVEMKALKGAEDELAAATRERATQYEALVEQVDGEIEAEARWAAWKPLTLELKVLAGQLYEPFKKQLEKYIAGQGRPNEVPPRLEDILGKASIFARMKRARPWELIPIAVFMALTAAAPSLLRLTAQYHLSADVLALASGAMGILRVMANYNRWATDQYERYEHQVTIERTTQAANRDARIEKHLAEQKATPTATSIPKLDEKIETLKTKVAQHRERVGFTAGYVSLGDFLKSRISEDVYEKPLGIMQRVQRDLLDLSDTLMMRDSDPYAAKKQEFFPRGTPRVVLFIDDLDRCPPETVVQVLEAAQLLVKTDLFVVVIAMDVRYVTRALEEKYRGILVRRGDPSGLDYIEKIVQIPYSVRPLDADAVKSYMQAQMHVAKAADEEPEGMDHAAGPAGAPAAQGRRDGGGGASPGAALPDSVLSFDRDEFELLQTACEHVSLSPRAMKRLANVYKLLKIIWYRSSRHPEPENDVKAVVVLLLALAYRHPDILRRPFDRLEREVEEASKRTLQSFFDDYVLEDQDAVTCLEWAECVASVKDPRLVESNFAVHRMDLVTFHLVQSFSFLGDFGYDPAELLQRAAAMHPTNGNGSDLVSRRASVSAKK